MRINHYLRVEYKVAFLLIHLSEVEQAKDSHNTAVNAVLLRVLESDNFFFVRIDAILCSKIVVF